MRSPITKLAAAAVVVVGAVLFIGLWDQSIPAAYALEQTIEANQSVRWLHIRNFTVGHEEPREGWIEFGENGQPQKVRAQMPEWASPVDGPRALVWKDGTVQMWLKKQNRLAITKADGAVQEQLNATLQKLDPRLILSHINDLKSQGKVEVAIEEPSDRARPITVTVTYPADNDNPGRRKILSVDPATKLINLIEVYQLKDGEYYPESRIELQEYNQPIDPGMFDLTNEVPPATERLDLSSTDLGLPQGHLSEEEVATAVVRRFFESLMARDYATAGRLLPLGADAVKQQFGRLKFLRIVSIGPAAATGSPSRQVVVPCTVEIEEDGRSNAVMLKGVTVHPLAAQPDRWAIQTLGE